MNQTIFITGGSGFLGINMVRFLLEKKKNIINYDIADFDYPEKSQIKSFVADIRDKKKLKKAMKGADVVLHFAAALPLYSKEDIFSTEIDGTRNVLEAALENGIKKVVYISSTAVYGIPDHHPIIETDKLIGVGPYGESKIKAEKICKVFRSKGMCVPVLRPKSFIGPERLGVFSLFYDWAKDGKNFPLIGNGRNRYQLLAVTDLCQAVWSAMNSDDKKVNDVFNIGAKEFKTMKEDYQSVLDFAGFGKKIICFPAKPVIFILKILEVLHLSPLYAWVYETAATDSSVSIKKAEKILKFNPKYSNQDALLENFQWYLKNLDEFQNTTGVSHRVPWSQGIFKIVKNFF
ncbi:MAG: NAD-dependent epimerase/dehydratase family protein [Candidatus Shapirobacteria bacterium]|nr:NAD-dependent epimerase/dehydratase family protein [Candidatus Shapirobacteria bacterium]MDD3002405.1 NAD-dependent epimerase/dehydratase family protein [Candidatus Shapirobacteria bacterium]MDD4383287.1 NAD-dependent epimerase/dehydratase family protein [Candidatus Shapirobacteria bacterium]